MRCVACGTENAHETPYCSSCGKPLDGSPPPVRVRVSRLAIGSSICALIAAVCFLPGLIAWLDPKLLHPQSEVARLTGMATLLAVASAFLLGIAGLGEIATNGGRRTGYPFAMAGTAAPFFLFLGLLYVPTFAGVKVSSYHLRCGTNLSSIGKAMLIYANDYQDMFPRAGGERSQWVARTPWWAAENRRQAYGLSDPNADDGRASISASLYLLVKYNQVPTKFFVCKGNEGTTEFHPAAYGAGTDPAGLWDFGPNPPRHCSYAYYMVHGSSRLTTALDSGIPIAADRNPGMDSPSARPRDFSSFQPDLPPFNGTSEQARQGNTACHQDDGQNVLFLDSHVEFKKRAFWRL